MDKYQVTFMFQDGIERKETIFTNDKNSALYFAIRCFQATKRERYLSLSERYSPLEGKLIKVKKLRLTKKDKEEFAAQASPKARSCEYTVTIKADLPAGVEPSAELQRFLTDGRAFVRSVLDNPEARITLGIRDK